MQLSEGDVWQWHKNLSGNPFARDAHPATFLPGTYGSLSLFEVYLAPPPLFPPPFGIIKRYLSSHKIVEGLRAQECGQKFTETGKERREWTTKEQSEGMGDGGKGRKMLNTHVTCFIYEALICKPGIWGRLCGL